jgi:hypothetical protein
MSKAAAAQNDRIAHAIITRATVAIPSGVLTKFSMIALLR